MTWFGDAWQEINLSALKYNLQSIREAVGPGVKICAVVKADAYGHGMIMCARALVEAGADVIATASLREALYLRRSLSNIKIWSMGAVSDDLLESAVVSGITVTISDVDHARRLSNIALLTGKTASLHFEVDTGFHRLGFNIDDAATLIPMMMSLPGLDVCGIFTHLSLIDEARDKAQMSTFFELTDKLSRSIELPDLHVADSIAAFRYPMWRLSMVRVGAMLYGNRIADANFIPRPVMKLCARIVSCRTIKAGESVGYDESYRAERDSVIATIPLGYADGLPRRLGRAGFASVRGVLVPYAGITCMDYSMLDVTKVRNIKVGDVVTVLGGEGEGAIPVESFAKWVGSNKNEPLSLTGRRVPRVYFEDGAVTSVIDRLLD